MAKANDKLRVVVVGCGEISAMWLDALRGQHESGQVEVVALVDVLEKAARNRAFEFGFHKAVISTDLVEVLKKHQVDVVCCCAIPEAHAQVCLIAFRHGCHVLTEKPLADNLPDARKIVRMAATKGISCAVMQNRRWHPGLRALCEFLHSEKMGPINSIHSDFYLSAHFGGFRETMKHVLLLDMAIHTFDAARAVAGTTAQHVYCYEWRPEGAQFSHGPNAVAIFQMNRGIVYTYRGSWCAEGLRTSWESTWRIVCEKGTVTWDGADEFKAEILSSKSGKGLLKPVRELKVPAPKNPVGQLTKASSRIDSMHARVLDDFLACVRDGRVPETNAADNIESLAMTFAAVKSAETGKRVPVQAMPKARAK